MASSIELKRAANEVEAGISGVQSALDRIKKSLEYIAAHELNTELTGLTAGEVITGNIDKERMIDAAVLGDSLIYFLRGVQSAANTTLLGLSPLNQAGLVDRMKKTGI